MSWITNGMQRFAQWRFRRRGRATMLDIESVEFSGILVTLEASGWKAFARYGGVDAGIDYDCIRLKRKGARLKCEWDPWDSWSIEGPAQVMAELAVRLNRTVTPQWRWAVREHSPSKPAMP